MIILQKLDRGELAVQISNIEWKIIKEYGVNEGMYSVSNNGYIRNNKTMHILKPGKDKDGYLRLILYGGSRKARRYFRVATLIAKYFVPVPGHLYDPTVDHIDKDIHNNIYTNLRWVERNYNSSIHENRCRGKDNPFYNKSHSKATIEHLREINTGKKYPEEVNKRKASHTNDPNFIKAVAVFENNDIKYYKTLKELGTDIGCYKVYCYASGRAGVPRHYFRQMKCYIYYYDEYTQNILTNK